MGDRTMRKYLGIALLLLVGCEQPRSTIEARRTEAPPPPSRFELTDLTDVRGLGTIGIVRDKKTESEYLVMQSDCSRPIVILPFPLPPHK